VCDRFSDSSRIYQGVLGGIDAVTIEDIIQFSTKGLKPDLTFLLDCDARVSMQRLALRAQASTAASRFDRQSQDYHERIRQGFLKLAEREPQRFCLVDASLSAQAMIEYAMAELRKRFGGSV
jgi:dTMP kinase